jgi:hypothetical protein
MKTIFASMLALGVCVWVGETRADGPSGDDDIALDSSVGSSDLAGVSVGKLTVLDADTHVQQNGTVDDNGVYNDGEISTGGAFNSNFASQGIVMQAANTGMNSLIQQTTTINVIFAPQN